jgi:hypothetical protein
MGLPIIHLNKDNRICQLYGVQSAVPPGTAFVPVPADFDLDILLAANYNRKTDTCGCFSFQIYTTAPGRR